MAKNFLHRLLRPGQLLLLLVIALTASGCFYSRELSGIRHDLEDAHPGIDLDRRVTVTVGPRLLRTLGWVVRQADDPDAQRAAYILYQVRRVKVGVYHAEHVSDLGAAVTDPIAPLEADGWVVAVKAQERDELGWLLYRERDDTVRDLLVVGLDDEELVIARLEGRLDRLLAAAMADEVAPSDLLDW